MTTTTITANNDTSPNVANSYTISMMMGGTQQGVSTDELEMQVLPDTSQVSGEFWNFPFFTNKLFFTALGITSTSKAPHNGKIKRAVRDRGGMGARDGMCLESGIFFFLSVS